MIVKKPYICTIKDAVKRMIYIAGTIAACYGFWGSLFPDLTLLDGTYRIVEQECGQASMSDLDKETLFAEILEGKFHVTYRSKIWETIRNKWGYGND